MDQKKNLLVWSDWVGAGTGFGTVSRYVLASLYESGMFNIDQLAINFTGEFTDQKQFPYQMIPSRLNNPREPYGTKMFLQSIASGKYDYVWIMNDTFVVEEASRQLPQVLQAMRKNGRKVPKIVYYYPVDCAVLKSASGMLTLADHVVPYCEFGKAETLKTLPHIENKMTVINHGVDLKTFSQLTRKQITDARAKVLGVKSDDTFVWMQANRNSRRKDIARSILAFKRFKETVTDDTKMYIHTAPQDTDIDLFVAVQELGLSLSDVIFPKNYAAHKPFPVNVLNMLYNCGDAFFTTTLGEGWGLTHLEAAATGIPIVAPNNTVFPEQLADGARGYLYDCKDLVYVDNSGYRPCGLIDDIVDKMTECYEDVKSGKALEKVNACKRYIATIQWSTIGEQWIQLFKDLESGKISTNSRTGPVGEML